MEVDRKGLDVMDRKILAVILEKFQGGPVGVETISASVSEERDTIEDVYEPFLIQQGFLKRTPRGRVATPAAWKHMGMEAPEDRRPGRAVRGRVTGVSPWEDADRGVALVAAGGAILAVSVVLSARFSCCFRK